MKLPVFHSYSMTNSELPGAGSGQSAPQQSNFAQPSLNSSFQGTPPPQINSKKQPNVLGLIALITAVIGFIFSCIPGALIIGWILLPIGFILALVALFMKDKVKWTAVTALIVSIVGTIVAVAVFFAVVQSSFSNAFGSGETKVSTPAGEANGSNEGGRTIRLGRQEPAKTHPRSVRASRPMIGEW